MCKRDDVLFSVSDSFNYDYLKDFLNHILIAMRNSINTIPFILILFFLPQIIIAQIHNFDSLYKNNESFKNYVETTPDFKDLFISEEVMNITIASDFKNLVKNKGQGRIPACLVPVSDE